MKKVKVYKCVADELDLIREIVNLIDAGMPETGYNFVEFKLSEIEYEDADGIFHYVNDIAKHSFEALGFKRDDLKDYIYTKGSIKMAFISNQQEDKFIIQRQS